MGGWVGGEENGRMRKACSTAYQAKKAAIWDIKHG